MGRTISVRLDGKGPATRSKNPKRIAEAEAVKRAFLDRPGAVVAVPNTDALAPMAEAAVESMLRAAKRGTR